VGPAPSGLDVKGEGVNPYVPILVLGAISAGFAVFSIGAGALAGPKRYNRAKLDAYECIAYAYVWRRGGLEWD
jgi:NADH:ubiquinone oxidoreductase subunit 3 (subunit A)